MKKLVVTGFILILGVSGFCAAADDILDGTVYNNVKNSFKKDYRTKNAEYLYNIKKEEENDRYRKKKMDRNPSGFMTMEEYEALSAPIDKTELESEIPKVEKGSDMKYVPQPVYKIVRYNNPPGSPELSIKRKIYTERQQNAQGITSPDYSMIVYPAIYYYPESAGVACDLFVIPLKENDTPLNKIMKANIMHRNPEPILSTDKSVKEKYTFRTLTPIDFSYDSTKLLVKEKIGSSEDGIWKTNAIVYDFETKTSYNLEELRAAIVYFWKSREGLDLDEKRWDILPLGFDLMSPNRVVANAFAYTGEKPVFLGTWSIDSKGEQTRLMSLSKSEVKIAMNGFKIINDGAISTDITKLEEQQLKRLEKTQEKKKKAEEKEELKKLDKEHKANLKELKEEYNKEKKEFKYLEKIEGSTSLNDSAEKYNDEKLIRDLEEEKRKINKELKELEKEEKRLEKESENTKQEENTSE